MDELGEWLWESVDNYERMTPIERLEFREEIDRLVADGHVIVIHGRKTQGKTYLLDRLPGLKENDADGT